MQNTYKSLQVNANSVSITLNNNKVVNIHNEDNYVMLHNVAYNVYSINSNTIEFIFVDAFDYVITMSYNDLAIALEENAIQILS